MASPAIVSGPRAEARIFAPGRAGPGYTPRRMFWRSKKAAKKPPANPAPGPEDSSGELSTTQFLTGDSDLDRRSVDVLLEAIAQVSQSGDLEQIMRDIVDRSIEITGAERGLLILAGGAPVGEGAAADAELTVRVARGTDGASIDDDLRFSTSVVRKVLGENQPVRATVQSDSDALELGRSVFDLKLRAVMCVPLATQDAADGDRAEPIHGALYVDSRAATRSFGHRDLSLFAALSQHIAIALRNAQSNLDRLEKVRLEQSLELASAIQGGLMPEIPDDVEGFEVHGWYRPAEQTSGDFFDFVRTRAKDLAVVIGDVTGHGIGPALITASAQASLRSYLRVVGGAGEAVTLLNQDLCERMDAGMFVSLLLFVLKEDGSCEIVNAGHPSPLVWRKGTGQVEAVEAHSPALGMLADFDYGVDATLVLEPGDLLLACTDGLAEAHPPDDRDTLFGDERIARVFAQRAADLDSAGELARGLAEEALAFSGGCAEDDITLVVARRTDAPRPA